MPAASRATLLVCPRCTRRKFSKEATAWLEAQGTAAAGSPSAHTNWGFQKVEFPDNQVLGVYGVLYETCFEIASDMPAGRYLQKRGLDLDIVNEHRAVQMGDPRKLWRGLLEKFGQNRLEAAGLVSRSGGFLFARHPCYSSYFDDDWPVYVQARGIHDDLQCKELSPAGLRSPAPFNADLLAQEPERVCICEGCIDTLSALRTRLSRGGCAGCDGLPYRVVPAISRC